MLNTIINLVTQTSNKTYEYKLPLLVKSLEKKLHVFNYNWKLLALTFFWMSLQNNLMLVILYLNNNIIFKLSHTIFSF